MATTDVMSHRVSTDSQQPRLSTLLSFSSDNELDLSLSRFSILNNKRFTAMSGIREVETYNGNEAEDAEREAVQDTKETSPETIAVELGNIQSEQVKKEQVIREATSNTQSDQYGDEDAEILKHNSEEDIRSAEQEVSVPDHPVPAMQAAFEESMLDAFAGKIAVPAPKPGDAADRRKKLLEQGLEEETHAGQWQVKSGQRYHELWKIVSQITFGIHLLLYGMAIDDDQALAILQGHVNEVDAFLESTLEDFDIAQDDIDDRLKNLKLPLENVHIFDGMLEDRAFRAGIVSGNETIEHIMTRTALAMKDALKSVQHGLDANKEFLKYMSEQAARTEWQDSRPEMMRVFEAMQGNAEGWHKAYVSLQTKANHLGIAIVQLGTVVHEIDRRAVEASQRTRFSIVPDGAKSPFASPPTSPHQSSRNSRVSQHSRRSAHSESMRSKQSRQSRPSVNRLSITKELPADPNIITPPIRETLPVFQMVSERERTPTPETNPSDSEVEVELEDFPEPQLLTLQPTVYTLEPRVYTPPPPTPRTDSGQILPSIQTQRETEQPPVIARGLSQRKKLSKPRPSPVPASSHDSQSSQSFAMRQSQQSSNSHLFLDSRQSQNSELSLPFRESQVSYHSQNSRQSQASQNSRGSQGTRHLSATANFPLPPSFPVPGHESNSTAVGSGFDSAHYSDASPRVVSVVGSSREEYHNFISGSNARQLGSPRLAAPPMASPRTHQPAWNGGLTSPASPMQRPWTAAPTHAPRFPSMSSEQQQYAHNSYSGVPIGMRSGTAQSGIYPSNMSQMTRMTVASGVTVGVDAQGKKIKKKRSGFGWLKKAFSLSEEEKSAFEERRRMAAMEQEQSGWERRERVFLDGKRVQSRDRDRARSRGRA